MHSDAIEKLHEVLEHLDAHGRHIEAAHVATVIDMLASNVITDDPDLDIQDN